VIIIRTMIRQKNREKKKTAEIMKIKTINMKTIL
jgi:hypothetical protein